MSRPKFNFVVLDPGSGKARPGAFVTFYDANTLTKTDLFADDDVSAVANPVQANGLGQVAVRVDPGVYDISMVWDGAQPTVVEDVVAWTPEASVITTTGDLIVGGPTGAPTRLPMGLENEILISHQGIVEWRYLESGVGFPVGTPGSLVGYSAVGQIVAIAPGLQDQALAMQGGIPTWVSTLLPPGTTLPISQPGDLVVGQVTTGAVARLARGETNDVLTVADTGGLVWGTTDAISRGGGDCYLKFNNSSSLLLHPYRGTSIWIDGRPRRLPAAGVPLAPTGLTADTLYWIYARWDGANVVLEASTTGHVYADGLYHKIGDPTRTLVGMAVPGAGPIWVDAEASRLVLSFFNTVDRAASNFLRAPRSLTGTGVTTEVHAEIRTAFCSWAGVATTMDVSGFVYTNLPGGVPASIYSFLVLDGVSISGHYVEATTVTSQANIGLTRSTVIGEGLHQLTLYGNVSVGSASATWHGEINGLVTTRLHALISGSYPN